MMMIASTSCKQLKPKTPKVSNIHRLEVKSYSEFHFLVISYVKEIRSSAINRITREETKTMVRKLIPLIDFAKRPTPKPFSEQSIRILMPFPQLKSTGYNPWHKHHRMLHLQTFFQTFNIGRIRKRSGNCLRHKLWKRGRHLIV